MSLIHFAAKYLHYRDLEDWSWSLRGIPLQNAGAKALLLQPEPFYGKEALNE